MSQNDCKTLGSGRNMCKICEKSRRRRRREGSEDISWTLLKCTSVLKILQDARVNKRQRLRAQSAETRLQESENFPPFSTESGN